MYDYNFIVNERLQFFQSLINSFDHLYNYKPNFPILDPIIFEKWLTQQTRLTYVISDNFIIILKNKSSKQPKIINHHLNILK